MEAAMQFKVLLPGLGSGKLSHAMQVAGDIWGQVWGCASSVLHEGIRFNPVGGGCTARCTPLVCILLLLSLLAGATLVAGAFWVGRKVAGWLWSSVILEAIAILVWWASPLLPPPPARATIRAAKKAGIRWKTAARKHQATGHRLAPRCKPAGQYVHPSKRPACWRLSALAVLVLLASSFSAAAAAGTGWACQGTLYTALSSNVGYAAMASHMAQHHLSPHVAVWHMCHPQDNWYSDRWRQAGPAYAAVTSFQPEGVMYPVPHDRYEKDADGGWVWGNHPDMPAEVMEQLKGVVRARKGTAFAYSMKDLPGYCGIEPPFEIKLDTTDPIFSRARRYSPGELKVTDEKCTELHGASIIRPAGRDAAHASAPTLPGKKDADGQWTDVRFCIDFRNLNRHTVADKYGMHRPDELFRQVCSSRFFSKVDCRSGFLQIPVAESSIDKTGFWWRNQLWCYTRMPFGLKNASAKFQRVIDCELAAAKLTGCAISFIDDLLIHSETAEQHVKDVAAVLDMLSRVGLRAHPDKTIIGASVIEYLGHNVSHHGLTPHQAKVSAIRALRAPTNVSELRSVLGFLNYYRCYVPGFSELAAPMNDLLKKDAKWQWGPEQAAALQQLKAALCQDGVALRRFDADAPTKLYTDWSKHGIAAVLTQAGPDGKEYLVACVSRSLNKHERNYSSYEGEMLAAVWGVLSLRSYLHGLQFTVVTDHQPLKWLVTTPELTGKHARWALCLMEYSYTIEHRPGKKHQNADVPSRFPTQSSHDGTGARLDPVAGEDPPSPSQPPAADASSTAAPSPSQPPAADASSIAAPSPSPPPAADASSTAAQSPSQPPAADASSTAAPSSSQPPADADASLVSTLDTAALAALRGSQLGADCLVAELSDVLHTISIDAALQQGPVASFMDGYAPTGSDQLAADLAAFADPDAEGDTAADAPAVERRRQSLLQLARSWVDKCSTKLRLQQPAPSLPLVAQFASNGTATQVASINTTPVGSSFFAAADRDGITLYEPFGGLCAGLQMCLALGVPVKRYLYSDTSEAARQVAQHRIAQLHGQYPASFPLQATADTFTALPQDVWCVDAAALQAAGAADSGQWLVVAGWECQDLSTAGKGKGLHGNRSNTFFPLVRMLAELQHMQQQAGGPPPGFLVENVAAQHNHKHPNVSTDDHNAICAVLGTPVTVDAPRFGSLAHRLRNFWTNLASPEWLRLVVQHVHPSTPRVVNSILGTGRSTQNVVSPDAHPFYQVNVPGQPMAALPTLVATPHSYAFRNGGPGMLRVNGTDKLVQLTLEEREQALGYPPGATAAPGVTPKQRHAITGSCMDGFTMRGLMATCTILYHLAPHLGALRGGTAPGPQADLQLAPRDLLQGPGGQLLRKAGWEVGQPLPAPSALAPIAAPLATAGQQGAMQRTGLGFTASAGQLPAGHRLQQKHSAAAGDHSSCTGAQQAASASASQGLQQLALCDQVLGSAGSSSGSDTSALSTRAVVNLPVTTPAFTGHGADGNSNSTYAHNCALLAQAHQRESEQPVRLRDIWQDTAALQFLRTGEHTSRDTAECKRVSKRAQHYQFVAGRLHRTMSDGTLREVPEPQQRADVIRQVHERTGHWGVKRTKHLLQHHYYWSRMEADVHQVLATCVACQQVAASFNHRPSDLQPLPIRGMFYRWGVDLCGPFPASSAGNTYCMLMIEHFTKHIELAAIPAKEPEHTARAFLASVLSRFGASAEVLTDNGAEFAAEFHQLLEECFIDHRHTSPLHPQADGLAERAIKSCKKALKTHVAATANTKDWDKYMHWLGLGYRCSRQSATGLSPYEMLYGTAPVIPPAIKERFAEPLDLDSPDIAAEHMQRRAALLQQHCVIAMGNLGAAQHRDTERYRRLRSADYQPRTTKFTAGDFVYRRRYLAPGQPTPALQTEARPGIYRVLEVRDSGVLVLQGQCGSTLHEHANNCAPCHLPNINTTIDPSLRQITADFPCCVCNSPEDEDIMVLCDGCGRGFHTYCLEPPLLSIPDGAWVCPTCVGKGISSEQAAQLQAAREKAQQAAQPAEALIPTAKQREVDELARQLDGRVVCKAVKRSDGTVQHLYGRLCFRGRLTKYPKHFRVDFANGTSQLLTFKTAKAWLQPEGTQLPADEPALLSVVLLCTSELPDTWQWEQPQGVCQALEGLTGVHVRSAEGEQLAAAVRGHISDALPGHVGTVSRQMHPTAMHVLMQAIDLHTVVHVLEPWHCTEQLGPLLQQYGPTSIRLSTNTVVHPPALRAEGHSEHLAIDPLQPASYRTWLRAAPAEVCIFKPPADLVDMALAVALAFCSSAVCMLVPNSHLTSTSYFRSSWFAQLQRAGVLVTLPCPRTTPAAVWLLVFKSPAARRRLMSGK